MLLRQIQYRLLPHIFHDDKDDDSPSLPPGFPPSANATSVSREYASVGGGDGDDDIDSGGGDGILDLAPDPDDDEDNDFDRNCYSYYEAASKPHDFTMKYTVRLRVLCRTFY